VIERTAELHHHLNYSLLCKYRDGYLHESWAYCRLATPASKVLSLTLYSKAGDRGRAFSGA
jgi:hypothetical protein